MSALSLVREYRLDLVYQLSQLPVSESNKSRKVLCENALAPAILMSLILAVSPSTTAKLRLTRLRSIGVTVVTTSVAYMLLLMYWRLSSCSARSTRALSKGRPSASPVSRSAFFSTSLSNSRVPVKSTSATVGRSSTMTTNTPLLASIRTSLNKPRLNKARMAAAALSSV